MSDNLRPTDVRFIRDRRRLTPRVLKVVYAAAGTSLTVKFKDRMDNQRHTATIRLFVQALGNLQFTNFSWSDEFTLTSTTVSNLGPYTGPSFARYMSGNIRSKRRFNVAERTKVEHLEAV